LLPEPDDSRAAGEHIVCPQCGKLYAVRKQKKRKFVCPGCQKKVVPPDEFDPEETFRCPWCQIVVRLIPRLPSPPPAGTGAGNKRRPDGVPVLLLESSITPDSDDSNGNDPEVEVAWYGESILIDDTPRRLPRSVWLIVGGLSATLVVGLIFFVVSQIESSTARVRGTVYYGEKPVNSGVITFVPNQGTPISTVIQENGVYQLENVPFTEMHITIAVYPEELKRLPQMSKQEKSDFFINWGRRPVTMLPAKYLEPESTPLKYTVAQAACVHDIHIAEEVLPPAEKRQPISEDD